MPVAYPFALRTVIRAPKSRSQPAVFAASEPRRGFSYFQAIGTDTPVVWDVTFRFDKCDAVNFMMWFTQDLQRGLLDFDLPIKTEFGLLTHTCRFLPDGLLDTRETGEVWEYSARITARAQIIPADAITAWGGAFVGPLLDQSPPLGAPYTLNLAPLFSGGVGPFAYVLHSGGLLPGLSLNGATGVISGTVVAPASFADVVFSRVDAFCVRRLTNPVRFETLAADPFFSSVLLLLHADGANGSTTFTDSSSYARTMSVAAGVPAISTSQSKFGGSSIYGGAGASQIITSRAGSEWNADDWTWETYLNRAVDAGYLGLFFQNQNLIVNLRTENDGGTYQLQVVVGAVTLAYSTSSVPIGTWTHLAVSAAKAGGTWTLRLFFNGALEATATTTNANAAMAAGAAQSISIGQSDPAGFAGMNAYIDEYRVTAGVARYTASFTPPTSPYAGY